ncbi:ribosome recycling factor [candidate division WOR-3 bacterium]|nr:ribosome recycling factor [candidate division WOR-3 bacterium]
MKTLSDIYKETSHKMRKSIEILEQELRTIRTGRASPSLVEGIKVLAYESSLPIKQVAAIACPEPNLIVIRPWDRNLIPEVEKAILKSDIGLTPSNDGVAIKLPIPLLTEERKKDLIKIVHRITEESKVSLRNIRRDAIAELKEIEGISDDAKYHGEKEIQHITDKHMEKLDKILENKEHEIMEE